MLVHPRMTACAYMSPVLSINMQQVGENTQKGYIFAHLWGELMLSAPFPSFFHACMQMDKQTKTSTAHHMVKITKNSLQVGLF